MMRQLLKLPHDPHPWDELWLDVAVKHPRVTNGGTKGISLRCLKEIDIPVYLGCDWENVPLHLPSTFVAWKALAHNPNVRDGDARPVRADVAVGEPARRGARLVRPLAQGPRHRHHRRRSDPLCAARRRASGAPASRGRPPATRTASSRCAPTARSPTTRASRVRATTWCSARDSTARQPSSIDPPAHAHVDERAARDGPSTSSARSNCAWSRSATAADTAWIATLQDVAPDGEVTDVTAGWLRASLREVDEAASAPGAPVLPCRTAVAVPIGEDVEYRIPLVPNARRFAAGPPHPVGARPATIRTRTTPAIMNFRHASVGTSSLNTIRSSSRLLLPVLA